MEIQLIALKGISTESTIRPKANASYLCVLGRMRSFLNSKEYNSSRKEKAEPASIPEQSNNSGALWNTRKSSTLLKALERITSLPNPDIS
jgi:hypothetical protein